MENPYDVHSWSKQYRAERLAEARARHLTERLQQENTASSAERSRLRLALATMVAHLRATGRARRAKPW